MNKHTLIAKGKLGEFMGMSVQAITQKIHKGKEGIDIPFALKIGNSYRWKLGTVMQFIDEKEHERKVLLSLPMRDDKPVSKVQINRV
tara:strand:- start:2199 stop:2459 length:261 start_codon:yes stop_codon:yes gene_type:complete